MRITERTKYEVFQGVEKYLSEKQVARLKQAAEQVYGAMYDLKFGTFWACAGGDFSHLGDMTKPTVLQVYWCKRFADFIDEFTKALKTYVVPMTPEEQRASEGLPQITWGESMLVFLQRYFHLHSFREAEDITTGELLIAKRAQYNEELFRRRLNKIQTQQLKQRLKK